MLMARYRRLVGCATSLGPYVLNSDPILRRAADDANARLAGLHIQRYRVNSRPLEPGWSSN